jgi:hypothetical protein
MKNTNTEICNSGGKNTTNIKRNIENIKKININKHSKSLISLKKLLLLIRMFFKCFYLLFFEIKKDECFLGNIILLFFYKYNNRKLDCIEKQVLFFKTGLIFKNICSGSMEGIL